MKSISAINTGTLTLGIWFCFALGCLGAGSGNGSASFRQDKPGPPDAAAIYAENCAACHGSDGRAKTSKGRRSGATDFRSDWNTDEARGVRIITNGKGQMPAFKGKLSSPDIRLVFKHVVRFKG